MCLFLQFTEQSRIQKEPDGQIELIILTMVQVAIKGKIVIQWLTSYYMNKRTSSQPLLVRSRPIESKPTQLEQLRDMLNHSKPILTSIYHKVKLKQAQHQTQMANKEQECQQVHNLGRQYRSAYTDALQIMQNHKVLDQYQGISNYRSASSSQLNILGAVQRKRGITGREHHRSTLDLHNNKHSVVTVKDYEHRARGQHHKMDNQSQQGSQMPSSIQSVYQKYRHKLERSEGCKQNRENTLNRVKRLSTEIEKDIVELRLSRQKNLKVLGKSDKVKLKDEASRRGKGDKLEGKGRKEYFAELQRRKLKQIV